MLAACWDLAAYVTGEGPCAGKIGTRSIVVPIGGQHLARRSDPFAHGLKKSFACRHKPTRGEKAVEND